MGDFSPHPPHINVSPPLSCCFPCHYPFLSIFLDWKGGVFNAREAKKGGKPLFFCFFQMLS
jgi:hypothetical protein